MTAVILAGGRGTRLRPYSLALPKPMLPIGTEPLLAVTVRCLAREGFDRVVLAGGALNGLMRAYFGDGSAFGLRIDYVTEAKPLGTMGPLTLVSLDGPALVLNGDLLTAVPFADVMRSHAEAGASLTMVVKRVIQSIPWGVVDAEDGRVRGFHEKPDLPLWVNTGIYVIEPAAVDCLAPGENADIGTLVQALGRRGEAISCYATDAYWRDVGSPRAFRAALRDYARRTDLRVLHAAPATQDPPGS